MTPHIWKTSGDSQDLTSIWKSRVELVRRDADRAIVFVGICLFLLGFAFGVVMRDVVLPWSPVNSEPPRSKISVITGSVPADRLVWIAGCKSTLRINLGL